MKKLDEIPGKNPFKVPEKYFEEVNRKILSDAREFNHEAQSAGFPERLRSFLAIAATVTGLLFLTYAGVKLLAPEAINPQVSAVVSQKDNDSYINDIDLLTLEENSATFDITREVPVVSSNEIIDYLMLEDIEISDIYEQL